MRSLTILAKIFFVVAGLSLLLSAVMLFGIPPFSDWPGVLHFVNLFLAFLFFFTGAMLQGMYASFQGAIEATKRLRAEGLQGMATVLATRDTGTTINDDPQAELRLEIALSGRPPYEVTTTQLIPRLQIGRLGAGDPLPVLVSPKNPNEVMIDWEAPFATRKKLG